MYKESEWHDLPEERKRQTKDSGCTYAADAKIGTNPDPGTKPPPPPGSVIVRTRVGIGNTHTDATRVRYCRAAKQTGLHRRRTTKTRRPYSVRAIRKLK